MTVRQYHALPTLNADINNCGESSTNAIRSFAQIVSLTRFLDILQDKGTVNDFHIGLNLRVQVFVILRFVS